MISNCVVSNWRLWMFPSSWPHCPHWFSSQFFSSINIRFILTREGKHFKYLISLFTFSLHLKSLSWIKRLLMVFTSHKTKFGHSLFLMFHSLTTERSKPFPSVESLILCGPILKILYSFSLRDQFLFHFNSFIEQKSVRYIKRVYIFQNISFVKCIQSFLWESGKDRCITCLTSCCHPDSSCKPH